MDKIWKQMDKWKAKDGGRENWMCSKWCRVHGFAVLAASCRESRREAFAVRMRLRRHCLVFPISSRFCRIGRSSVCVVAMTTIVSRKVVRTQKYKTRSFFFCNVSAKYGVTRFKVQEALAPFTKRLQRDVSLCYRNNYFSLLYSFLQFTPVSITVLIGSEMLFIYRNVREI